MSKTCSYKCCYYYLTNRSRLVPTLVTALSDVVITQVAAGSMHSAAVSNEGILYTWGKGSYGRLGHG